MDFGAKIRSKGDLKSRNFGDISRPLARGGQMGLQGLQNGAKMVPKGGQGRPKRARMPKLLHNTVAPSSELPGAKGGQKCPECKVSGGVHTVAPSLKKLVRMRGPKHIRKASKESNVRKGSKTKHKHSSHSRRMSNILKDSEASEASKSSQASYASIARPQILYCLKSASVAAKSAPRRPGDLFGEPPSNFGEPRNPQIFYYLKSASVAAKIAPEAPRGIFGEIMGTPPGNYGEPREK